MKKSHTQEFALGKVLVLGGAGFIGFHLSKRLLQENKSLTICDDLSRGAKDPEFEKMCQSKKVCFLSLDLTQKGSFSQLNDHYDEVYLLASIVGVKNVEKDPMRVMAVNTQIVYNTISWASENHHRIGKILYSSTSEVYSGGVDMGNISIPTSEDVPITIGDIYNPRSSYAVSKLWGEAFCLYACQYNNLKIAIVRYHNVYGPRMGMAHVIPEILNRIINQKNPLILYGQDQSRAFCFVSDAIEASIAVMRCSETVNQIVHIGNDEEIVIADLLNLILETTSYQAKIDHRPAPEGSVQRRCPDVTKLYKLTGFKPKFSLKEGLKITADWHINHIVH